MVYLGPGCKRYRGDDLKFQEMKIGHSARSCIRQAMS